MATGDCGACAEVKNCNRVVPWTKYPTLAFRLLCSIYDAIVSLGGGGAWDKIGFTALSNTPERILSVPGKFGGYYFYNPNQDEEAYIQVYDLLADAVPGTTPPTLVYGIPAGSAANVVTDRGINIENGLQIAATTTSTGGTANTLPLIADIYFEEE